MLDVKVKCMKTITNEIIVILVRENVLIPAAQTN